MCRSAAQEAPWDRGGWPTAGEVLPTAPRMSPKPLGTSQSPSQAAGVGGQGQAPGSPPASGWGQGQGCAVLSQEELGMCRTQSCPRLPRAAWIKQEETWGPCTSQGCSRHSGGCSEAADNLGSLPACPIHPASPTVTAVPRSCCQTLCHAPFLSLGGGRRIGQNLPTARAGTGNGAGGLRR